MSQAYKELAQVNPVATTLTDAYTVPAVTQALVVVCVVNRSATPTSFRFSVAVGGAADNAKQYKAYDAAIGPNATEEFGPYALETGDIVRVYATLATLSFSINGIEIT